MGRRRRKHLFVLLFVLGLIAVSAAGHREQVDAAGPRPQRGRAARPPGPADPAAADDHQRLDGTRDGHHSLADATSWASRRSRWLAVGTDQIQVGIPGATSVGKATECATQPARLFFYDWEPNLIGRERAIGGHPGQEPPAGVARPPKRNGSKRAATLKSPRTPQLDLRRRLPDRVRRGQAGCRTATGEGLPTVQPADEATSCSRRTSRTS